MSDTIFAPATAPGRGAVAVVRISGARAAATVAAVAGGLPAPRRASVRRLRGEDGELIDEALVLWLPGPASFTGEDSAEFQVHGGPAVVAAVCELLVRLGLRLAEPGEFTRRAFQSGRLDLAQAEAVADLVDAETGSQRRQALAQLDGALSRRYEDWRDRLLDALAQLEAEVDFPDEEVPDDVGRAADPLLAQVLDEMRAAAGDLHGERVRDGFRIALIGAPNVGKSSLLNALVSREAAIVTDIAGTTRDIVEAPLVIAGQSVIVADTAGLHETRDVIEAEGVRRARRWADGADLRIGVVDLTRPETRGAAEAELRPGDILALNKRDVWSGDPSFNGLAGVELVETSARDEAGLAALSLAISRRVEGAASGEFPAVTRSRHRALLREAIEHLERNTLGPLLLSELAAENVRLALRALERVTGRVNPDAVLDRVFASFCIGK